MATRSHGKIIFFTFTSCLSDHFRTSYNVAEMRFPVDPDADKGHQPRPDNTVYMVIRPVKTIRMGVIDNYLKKEMAFDRSVLEAISIILSHLLLDSIMLIHIQTFLITLCAKSLPSNIP